MCIRDSYICRFHFAANQHPECNGRIVMATRDMAAGEHHHHKRRANCERRNHASSRANTGASDSQDKEEGSNEFCYVLVHNLRFYQLSRELAIMNDWGK